MRLPNPLIGPLTACTLAFAVGTATAQDSAARDADSGRSAQARESDEGSDAEKARDRRSDGDRQDASTRQGTSDREREEAASHFLAGYYAGYADGWVDGSDEIVIGLVQRQKGQARRQAKRGESPDRIQQGRRDARDSMRNRMRGESRDGQAARPGFRRGDNPERGPTVTVSGEVVSVETVAVRDGDPEHRVARVETDEGGRLIIDLGPAEETRGLNIGKGDRIEVEGTTLRIGGSTVVASRRVTKGDRTVEILYDSLSITDDEDAWKDRAANYGENRDGSRSGRDAETDRSR